MDRDEILNKSRSENQNGDEREIQVNAKAGDMAFRFVGTLCMILILIERLLCNTSKVVPPLFAVYLFMAASSEIYTGLVLKSKKRWIVGSIYGMLCIAFLVFFILDCAGM